VNKLSDSFECRAFPPNFPPQLPVLGFVFADANLPLPDGTRTTVPFANPLLLSGATSTGAGITVLEAGIYQVQYDLTLSFEGPGEYDFGAGISTDGTTIIAGSTSRIAGEFVGPPTFVDQLNKTVLVQVFGPTTFSVIVANNSTGLGAKRIQLASLSVTQIA
jgi:hypothetical protein